MGDVGVFLWSGRFGPCNHSELAHLARPPLCDCRRRVKWIFRGDAKSKICRRFRRPSRSMESTGKRIREHLGKCLCRRCIRTSKCTRRSCYRFVKSGRIWNQIRRAASFAMGRTRRPESLGAWQWRLRSMPEELKERRNWPPVPRPLPPPPNLPPPPPPKK